MAAMRPTMRLKRVLLPTLGRPTMATLGLAVPRTGSRGGCGSWARLLMGLDSGCCSVLLVSEAAEDVGALAPVLLHLHQQVQVDVRVEQLLDPLAGRGADGLQHLPALADDDR